MPIFGLAAFQLAAPIILDVEGRLNDHPTTDPDGGVTNFGISQKQNPDVDVPHLTRATAIALYQVKYWRPCGADSTPWPLCAVLFDAAVNQGVGEAIVLAQRACKLREDGVLGPVTLAALLAGEPWDLAARLASVRLRAYLLDREFQQDGAGWFYRVSRVLLAAGHAAGST
jgi:lysozyme family protein